MSKENGRGLHREIREVVRPYEPKREEKTVIDELLGRYREEAATAQNWALGDIRVMRLSEALAEYADVRLTAEGTLKVELKNEYAGHSIICGDIPETETSIIFVLRDEGEEKVVDGLVVVNGNRAIDLGKVIRGWGVAEIALCGLEDEHEEGEVVMGGDYDRGRKRIRIFGKGPLYVVAHEAGHHWQNGPTVRLKEKLEETETESFWSKLMPTLGALLNKKAQNSEIYEALIRKNINERNADAFAVAVIRRCRELGVPIVADAHILDLLKNRRGLRNAVDSYVADVIRNIKE